MSIPDDKVVSVFVDIGDDSDDPHVGNYVSNYNPVVNFLDFNVD